MEKLKSTAFSFSFIYIFSTSFLCIWFYWPTRNYFFTVHLILLAQTKNNVHFTFISSGSKVHNPLTRVLIYLFFLFLVSIIKFKYDISGIPKRVKCTKRIKKKRDFDSCVIKILNFEICKIIFLSNFFYKFVRLLWWNRWN